MSNRNNPFSNHIDFNARMAAGELVVTFDEVDELGDELFEAARVAAVLYGGHLVQDSDAEGWRFVATEPLPFGDE